MYASSLLFQFQNFYCYCCLLQKTSFLDLKVLENAWTSETMDSENAKYFKNEICKTLYCFIVPLLWHDARLLQLLLFFMRSGSKMSISTYNWGVVKKVRHDYGRSNNFNWKTHITVVRALIVNCRIDTRYKLLVSSSMPSKSVSISTTSNDQSFNIPS